jgi:hypothetical protein
MPTTTKAHESTSELASRHILGNAEHLKAFGEALTQAADAFMAEYRASEAEGTQHEDLGRNLSEASKVFHRVLAASSQRVLDASFGEEKGQKPPHDRRIEPKHAGLEKRDG